MRDDRLGCALIAIVRDAIAGALAVPDSNEAGDAWKAIMTHPALAAPGAAFVTLFRHGTLRGCIGSLEPRRPLGEDVRANALAAAFSDPRFPPLTAVEFPGIRVELSLLSVTEPVENRGEQSLLQVLRPNVDGVVLEYAGRRATFLPQVWESLPEPAEFLAELKRKAGLPVDFWSASIKASRYAVTKWRESELRADLPSGSTAGARDASLEGAAGVSGDPLRAAEAAS